MKEISMPFVIRTKDNYCDGECKALFEYQVGGAGLTRCLLFDEQLYWDPKIDPMAKALCKRCPRCKRAERELGELQ